MVTTSVRLSFKRHREGQVSTPERPAVKVKAPARRLAGPRHPFIKLRSTHRKGWAERLKWPSHSKVDAISRKGLEMRG